MACNCKKKSEPVQQPQVQISVTEESTKDPNQNGVQLTQEQQDQVNKIVEKINELGQNQ